MKPVVSIIIPVKDNLRYTKQCLQSIYETPPDNDFEIIVIDNASTDGTLAFLTEEQTEQHLRYYRNDPPKPFASSCNRGAKMAAGEYLLFLNNDTIALPGWLDAMLKLVRNDGTIGAIGAKLLYEDETVQHAGVAFIYHQMLQRVTPFHIFKDFPRNAPAVSKLREFKAVTGACLLTPASCFKEVEGFDEGYINCFEDVDYCLKLGERGLRTIYTPEAELYHFESKTAGREDHHVESGIRLLSKWGSVMQPDERSYHEPEGFVMHQDKHDLMLSPGPGIMRELEQVQRMVADDNFDAALSVIEKFEVELPANQYLLDMKNNCLTKMKKKKSQIETKTVSNKAETPLASIIIPVRNNLHFTQKCLASIAAAPPDSSYEIIVVDNDSTDGTDAYLASKSQAGELSYFTNKPSKNFAASCNIGAARANGKYLVFLNNDIEAFPGWLDALIETAERNEDAGAVGAKLLYPDGTIQHAGVAFHYFIKQQQLGPYHIFRKLPQTSPAVNREREFQVVTGACLLTPRELFQSIGCFDEAFINCFEDVDYCLRLRSKGYKVIYTPKATLIHYEGQTSGRRDGESESYNRLNKLWGDVMSADDVNLLEQEGFIIQEEGDGNVSIFPGEELQEWWKMIQQLIELGQDRMALEEVEKLEQIIGDKNGTLVKLKADILLKLGYTQSARIQYARLQRLDPEIPDSWWGLAQVSSLEKKFDSAEKYLNRLLNEFPSDPLYDQWLTFAKSLKPLKAASESDTLLPEALPL